MSLLNSTLAATWRMDCREQQLMQEGCWETPAKPPVREWTGEGSERGDRRDER